MTSSRMMLASLCIAALSACTSSSPVRVDKAETDLGRCQTFDWLPPTKEAASFTDQRVRAAALAEIERKGYTLSSENPDCRISYVLSTHEIPAAKPRVGAGVGGGSGGIGGGIGVSLPVGRRDRSAGTVTIDIVDVAKNSQIWSGSLEATFATQELSEDEAREVVARILGEFPDKDG